MQLPEIFVVHRHDPRNIGDMACAPSNYVEAFPWLKGATTIDILSEISRYSERLAHAYVIYGGGGLLGTRFFERQLNELLAIRPPRIVVWSAGHNDHDAQSIQHAGDLEKFHMVGVRDDDQSVDWVPCVSAMIPALSNPGPPRHSLVAYRHWDDAFAGPLSEVEGMPILRNNHPNLEETLAFLASGETILTNSYHGAYWGTLLGRRVVVVSPFSSKFYGLRYKVPIVTDGSWKAALSQTRVYPEALAECRARNVEFGDRVRVLFGR